MSLMLEVELLTGIYRAALSDRITREWPPHPERLFSALVQAWSDGGRRDDEAAALRWLEQQPPPDIYASPLNDVHERDTAIAYVPPNDKTDASILPDRRRRQPRTFPAVVPASPIIRFRWSAEPPDGHGRRLADLSARIASLGHSSSLVRAAATHGGSPENDAARPWIPSESGSVSVRSPYTGRFDDLERWFSGAGGRQERPRSLRSVPYAAPSGATATYASSVFGGARDWFVFEDTGARGYRPDVLGFAYVAKRVREALMKHGPQPSPEVISGHGAPNERSERPHLAIVPLLNAGAGWSHASGDLLGFAVILPRSLSAAERQMALEALAHFAPPDAEGTARARVEMGVGRSWQVERSPSPSRSSLKPDRYCDVSRNWTSVTPVVLDRFPKRMDPREEAEIIARACAAIGLPEPEQIELHKHAAVNGAESAYHKALRGQLTWRFSHGSKFADRPRRHVVLRFPRSVRGPVLLGAGRFQGFGLCLPFGGER